MAQLSDINWNIVKFQYEMLGYTLIELMAEYDVSESVMKYQSRNWEQLPISQRKELNFIRTGDIDKLTDDVVRQVRNETNLISLAKQKELFPLYVRLEYILLAKSVAIAQALPEEASSITAIRNLLGTLHKLIEKNPIINPQSEKVEEDTTGPQKVQVEFVGASTDQSTGETSALSDEEEAV